MSIERNGLKDPGKEQKGMGPEWGDVLLLRKAETHLRCVFPTQSCLCRKAKFMERKHFFSQNTHFETWTMLGTFAKSLSERA